MLLELPIVPKHIKTCNAKFFGITRLSIRNIQTEKHLK
jgi:hypothetical protein